jgi:predicted aldo/keto reductase-like oxidoreductase
MDIDHHPGIGGLRLAADRGLAVVITDPLKGGRLTRNIPERVARIWADASPERSPAEWGLRWVWDNPEVATVVSNMSTLAQVQENIALADSVEPDILTIPEQVIISRVRDAYRQLRPIPCTGCRSCMPCPQGIDAPRIFELYNDAMMYGDTEMAHSLYRLEGHDIDDCDECSVCARACGRKIDIPAWLKNVDQLLNMKE